MPDQRGRPDHPSGAPARHCMAFREAADRHNLLRKLSCEARDAPPRGEPRIHFIRHDPEVVRPGEIADHAHVALGNNHATRVIWRCNKKRARARRDRPGERIKIHPKIRACRHAHELRARHLDRRRIGRVHRFAGNHFIARACEAKRCSKERVLGAGEEYYVLAADLLAGARVMQFRNCGAQRLAPRKRRIMRIATAQGLDCTVDDRRRRVDVGIAHAQDHDILAPFARCECLVMRIPRIRALACDPRHQSRITCPLPHTANVPRNLASPLDGLHTFIFSVRFAQQ